MSEQLVTEVPSSLKQLARLVVRGFYTVEDALIIDMLVRNPCLKEDDIAELLKFEKKMLRARLTMLKNDKFVQARVKMETGPDAKAHKVNFFYINYKTFVNVIKFKLDMMRKRLETEERDATSRASFKCTNCSKTFTDLEVDQLFDINTQEFTCLFCGNLVEEDLSAMPKQDSRLMLARFNEQLQPLYDLLREVEGIKLAPSVLEPEPVDIDFIRGIIKPSDHNADQVWSGEATRSGGFAVEEARVDITIGDADTTDSTVPKKERPVWMTTSTVISNEPDESNDAESLLEKVAQTSSQSNPWSKSSTTTSGRGKKDNEDNIVSLLLAHEKQTTKTNTDAVKNLGTNNQDSSGDSSGDDDDKYDNTEIRKSANRNLIFHLIDFRF
jgi:transcription initiation factor TFIIE subunit alpha